MTDLPEIPEIAAKLRFSPAQAGPEGFSLDVDLVLPGSGFTAVFGESGCGKTTLLRCLAGLEKHSCGEIRVGTEIWQDSRSFLPAHERQLGYVFQESSLLPHLTVAANLGYGRRSQFRKESPSCLNILELMGIGALLEQYPRALSGGERQRVAIARALLNAPRLLLMDEPLASLDLARKREILPYLERLQEEFSLPVIYVTHGVDEVARLADHLVVLDRGRAVAQGSLQEVLSDIALSVELGEDSGVVIEATVAERDRNWHLIRAQFPGGDLWVRDSGEVIGHRIRIRVLARDVSLALSLHEDSSIINRLPATVVELQQDDDEAMMRVRLAVESTPMIARISRRSAHHLNIREGSKLWAQVKSVAILS